MRDYDGVILCLLLLHCALLHKGLCTLSWEDGLAGLPVWVPNAQQARGAKTIGNGNAFLSKQPGPWESQRAGRPLQHADRQGSSPSPWHAFFVRHRHQWIRFSRSVFICN
jgi:hypothetical protein